MTRLEITPLDPDSPKGRELAKRLTEVLADIELAIAGRTRAAVRIVELVRAVVQMPRHQRDTVLKQAAAMLGPFALDSRALVLRHAVSACVDADGKQDQAAVELLATLSAPVLNPPRTTTRGES